MKSRFFLDVVVRESSAVFKLLSGEDESKERNERKEE
jgi:hypothetical protein